MSLAFFNTLFPDTGSGRDLGYVVLALFPEGEFTTSPSSGPTDLHFFSWPSQKDNLVAFCLANHKSDIYTSAALYKTKGSRKASSIAHQWAAYADADTLDLTKVKAEPTMVVRTSPGRHHLYWVTEADDPARLTAVSRTIAHTHAADGCDKGGWDAGQLLRVPGSANNKYRLFDGSPVEVTLTNQGAPYGIAKLEEIYPASAVPAPTTEPSDMPPRDTWHNTPAVLKEVQEIFLYEPDIEDMFTTKLRPGQDRSATMWRFLGMLSRYGTSRPTAMYLAWEAPFNKYRIENRSEEDLWAELCRAYDEPGNKPVTTSIQAAERELLDATEDNPQRKAQRVADAVQLLTPGERAKVPTDTFVDRFVEWAKTCTDAPEIYHRSGALMILTSIFGEFGRCPVPHGEANLTLWFMILGPTTRARKTTSMNLATDMLADLQNKRYQYLLGSDVTAEALNVVLPKKDGRTSVFFRDEAHGLFTEQDKKHYMTGLREKFTDLFGGRVPVALRASTMGTFGKSDDDEDSDLPSVKIRTNFVMYLAGTTDQTAQALTIKDYQSGHLARFITAVADPPPMTRASMYTAQYDGSDEAFDGARHSLVTLLDDARDFWQQITPPGALKFVHFDDDAWDRLQDTQWQLLEPTKDTEMEELMSATAKRMGDCVMKTCILLAMVERKTKVNMIHVYKAMELAEEWYSNALNIAGRIMYSSWSGFQNEMISMIRGRLDGVTQAEIYARFRNKMQEKEIESALNVITKAGEVNRFLTGGRVRFVNAKRT